MGINNYNDEERKYSNLLKDLGELPRIKAPDNFEYNLKVRIQNRSFEDLEEAQKNFNFIKFLAPSAVVITVLILFFVFFPTSEQQVDNPLMSDPPVIESMENQVQEIIKESQSISPKTKLRREESLNAESESQTFTDQDYKVVVGPNDVVVREKLKYPIFKNRSVALDDYISGGNQRNNDIQRGNIVRGGDEGFDFEGFLLRQQPDQKTMQKYRAMMDSVKKAEYKADSIKKAGK